MFKRLVPSRRFVLGAAAAALLPGKMAKAQRAPEFIYRLGTNQPLESPTVIRLNEMAAATLTESDGRLRIDVFGAGKLGSDNAMIGDVRAGRLELYMAGNNLGEFSAVSEMPSLPFVFKDDAAVFAALDGALGEFIRRDLARSGLHAFSSYWQNGFHQLTTNSRPILKASDLQGLAIRTPVQTMPAEFFKLFGAEPKGITFDSMYAALRDHVVDGQTDPLAFVISLKLYEVQRYLSMTNHWWSGLLLVSPQAAWDRLLPDVKAVLSQNVQRFALLQREDVNAINRSGMAFLKSIGMQVTTADTDSFKAGLGDFYKKWRSTYGTEAWTVLQRYSDQIG